MHELHTPHCKSSKFVRNTNSPGACELSEDKTFVQCNFEVNGN